jgi:nucleoside-diphosphate-sugar epimerase
VRTALVTGHRGFIGRHVSAALAAAGWDVTGIDIATGTDARRFFRKSAQGFDLVVHAAAVVGGRAVIDGSPLDLAVNLELDAAMFRWAARTRPGRVVYLSSSAVYPVHLQARPGTLLAEHAVNGLRLYGQPDALYGWAKLTGEKLAALARSEGVPVTIVRPFSGYGEDQDDCYPFPAMAARARRRDDPFAIWGSGDQVRDFIHVTDICAALLVMISEGIDGPVNLGTGRPVSMRDLAVMFCSAAGYSPDFKPLPEMPSGVAWRVADVTAMNEFYQPQVSLEDGVAAAMKGCEYDG